MSKDQVSEPKFHPIMFEGQSDYQRKTLPDIEKERGQRLPKGDVSSLVSPGRHNFTTDDHKIAESNTKYLFKNLYGETLLTYLFFSDKNIQNIQNVMKLLVFKEYNYIIDDQSVNELMIIMRSIFLEYSAHPPLIDESMTPEEKARLQLMYKAEVARLNEIVISTVVPRVISQLQGYLDYLRDAKEQPYQMETPKNDSIKGQRNYRSVTQVLTGSTL
jgi:hypothetical protein